MAGLVGQHSHKCTVPTCGHIWSHDDVSPYNIYTHYKNEREYHDAHTCPACGGSNVREKYFGEGAVIHGYGNALLVAISAVNDAASGAQGPEGLLELLERADMMERRARTQAQAKRRPRSEDDIAADFLGIRRRY